MLVRRLFTPGPGFHQFQFKSYIIIGRLQIRNFCLIAASHAILQIAIASRGFCKIHSDPTHIESAHHWRKFCRK
jgi:hypothetical protein